MKWTEEETLKFVGLYHENECLWNMKIPNYKNKSLRQKAVESLVVDMKKEGFGLAEAKQKIKNLRSTYNQEILKIKKSKKSGAGLVDVYIPTLKWFPTFDLIMKSCKGKAETINNMADDDIEDMAMEQLDEESETIMSEQESTLCSENTNRVLPATSRPVQPPLKRSLPASSSSFTRENKTKRRFQELSNAVTNLKVMSENLNAPEPNISEHEMFGKHVAKCLDGLGALEATLAQQAIQNILTKYKVKMLQVEAEHEQYIVFEDDERDGLVTVTNVPQTNIDHEEYDADTSNLTT